MLSNCVKNEKEAEYKKSLIKYYKLQTIINIIKRSLQNPTISSNKILKEYLLLDWMPKIQLHLELPIQRSPKITILPAKEYEILRNYLHQQIPIFCEPLIVHHKTLLKKHPKTFDNSFTGDQEIGMLLERRKFLISSILDAKRRKFEMLMKLIEMRISQENQDEQETMFLKFRMKELKARVIKQSIEKSIEGEGSNTLEAYRKIEKHLDKLLCARGLSN